MGAEKVARSSPYGELRDIFSGSGSFSVNGPSERHGTRNVEKPILKTLDVSKMTTRRVLPDFQAAFRMPLLEILDAKSGNSVKVVFLSRGLL